MAPRPKNPPPDRRQEILEAALQVFSAKGYAAATNADIAREAGVTAAALYYYFPSKADLFRAVLTERKTAILPEVSAVVDQVLEMPPELVLPNIIRAMNSFMSDERTRAIFRIVLSEGPRNPEVLEIYQSQVINQMAPMVIHYLQRQMELGRLKEMDPRLIALLTAGSVMVTVILRDILKLDIAQGLDQEMVSQGIIDVILPGILTQPKE